MRVRIAVTHQTLRDTEQLVAKHEADARTTGTRPQLSGGPAAGEQCAVHDQALHASQRSV